jgi:acetyl esterase/lipase
MTSCCRAAPIYGDPSRLPPTLIQVGSDEILLDDSVQMAGRMRAAGCEVELEVWPRMPHAWHVWARLMPEAGAAIARIGVFVQEKWRLADVVAWTNLLTQESRIDSRLLFAEGSLDSRTDDRR